MTLLSSEVRRAQPLLGTIVEITACGPDANNAVNAAFQQIREIHRLMSFHEVNSDISRINQAKILVPVSIDAHTYHVLTFAQALSKRTQGIFDVTIGNRLIQAGFLPKISETDLSQMGNYQNISLLPDHQVLINKPVCIDLGGIAKGYAVDVAIDTLLQANMEYALVNAGGDLRFFGKLQIIHLRNPDCADELFTLGPLGKTAVASSSGYYTHKSYNASIIGPLVHPQTGMCQCWKHGITVVAPFCMIADALTKVVSLDPSIAVSVLNHFNARAFCIDQNGIRQLTSVIPN